MKLFTVGPVMMDEKTLETAGKQLPYFRTEEFSLLMKENEHWIKTLVHAEQEDLALFLTCSGSGAMEAVVSNCFDENDHVLIIDGGSFGHRFVQLCDLYHIRHTDIRLSFMEKLEQKHLDQIKEDSLTAILVNQHETSTGQLYDMRMLKEFARKRGLFLVSDAISSFLADECFLGEEGADALIVSSQKALALSPGLSVVLMKRAFYEATAAQKKEKQMYLSLKQHARNMERGQTPFTPAVGILLELHARLKQLCACSGESEQETIRKRAQYFRRLCQRSGFLVPASYPLSNALTPMYFPDGRAKELYEYLKEEGYYVTPCAGELAGCLLRIGHLGALSLQDYDDLIRRMKSFYQTRRPRKVFLMAAGMGKRISEMTDKPKCLLKVGGIPLIEHTVRQLLKNHLDVHIITGYKGELIREALKEYPIHFYENPFYQDTNSIASLWFVREELLFCGDVLLMNADVYWEQDVLDQLLKSDKEVTLLMDKSRALAGDYFFRVEDGKLREYGKELPAERRSGEYVGLAKIRGSFTEHMVRQLNRLISNGEYRKWWEDTLYSLIDEYDIYVEDIEGKFWSEIDVYEDYQRILAYLKKEESFDSNDGQ